MGQLSVHRLAARNNTNLLGKKSRAFHKKERTHSNSKFEELLREKPSLISKLDQDGRTSVHWAAAKGHIKFLRLMATMDKTEFNKAIILKDNDNKTPLDYALERFHFSTLRHLLKNASEAGITPQIVITEENQESADEFLKWTQKNRPHTNQRFLAACVTVSDTESFDNGVVVERVRTASHSSSSSNEERELASRKSEPPITLDGIQGNALLQNIIEHPQSINTTLLESATADELKQIINFIIDQLCDKALSTGQSVPTDHRSLIIVTKRFLLAKLSRQGHPP